jgi:hypothetical protein
MGDLVVNEADSRLAHPAAAPRELNLAGVPLFLREKLTALPI